MILSVSRRTDIPAFYSDWFFKQLDQGFVLVPNHINPIKIAKIKLEPLKIKNIQLSLFDNIDNENKNLNNHKNLEISGNIEGMVFWTKNPAPMLDKMEKLKDYKYYFLYTLNAYPESIEAHLPSLSERIESFKKLSTYCPVIWRYDPILIADGIDIDWHIEKFTYLCQQLKGYTKHCKFSFLITSYNGCSRSVYAPNLEQKHKILSAFSKIAKENDISLDSCAESDWTEYGIQPSKCIDGEIFEALLTDKLKDENIVVKRKNHKLDGQRKNCGCMPAVDIGRYDTCFHGCTYCYARKSNQKTMLDIPHGEIYERKTELEFDYT